MSFNKAVLILAACLVLGILIGCSSSTEPRSTKDSTSTCPENSFITVIRSKTDTVRQTATCFTLDTTKKFVKP